MLYALICTDKTPEGLQLRLDTRADHLAFLDGLGSRLKMAGPFLDDDGTPRGSLVIIEARSMEEARKVAARDPYAKAGLFDSVDIRAFNWVLPKGSN